MNYASVPTVGGKLEIPDERTIWQKFDDWIWYGQQDIFEDQVYMAPRFPAPDALD